MKTDELADLLDGFVAFMEKHATKTSLNDVRAVSGCLRQFPGENVTTFCDFIVRAKAGKTARGKSAPRVDQGKVGSMLDKINNFLEHRRLLGYAQIEEIIADLGDLSLADMKAVGERLEGPTSARSKPSMLKAWRNWLQSIKSSAEQSAFNLSGAATS
ncbi:MAG: hypothetical protein HYR84_02620 [Planctomycetes bacterium]|nr:hypothetical protein [Planctomycetota bacterium]